jgi:hypothetical protein
LVLSKEISLPESRVIMFSKLTGRMIPVLVGGMVLMLVVICLLVTYRFHPLQDEPATILGSGYEFQRSVHSEEGNLAIINRHCRGKGAPSFSTPVVYGTNSLPQFMLQAPFRDRMKREVRTEHEQNCFEFNSYRSQIFFLGIGENDSLDSYISIASWSARPLKSSGSEFRFSGEHKLNILRDKYRFSIKDFEEEIRLQPVKFTIYEDRLILAKDYKYYFIKELEDYYRTELTYLLGASFPDNIKTYQLLENPDYIASR